MPAPRHTASPPPRGLRRQAWGALLQAEELLLLAGPPRDSTAALAAFALLPEADAALRAVATHCASHAGKAPPAPPVAEELFLQDVAARQAGKDQRSAELIRISCSGDRRSLLQASQRPPTLLPFL